MIYCSDYGSGPMRAKIVASINGRLRMYRWMKKSGDARRVYFTLPAAFLSSQSCGWRVCAKP